MECGRQQVSLLNGDDRLIIEPSQDVDVGPHALYRGCPDEDGVEWCVTKLWDGEVRLEAVDLAPEGLATHTDVHQVEQWLAPNLGREPLDAQGIEAALAAGRTVIIGTEWHAHIRAAAPAPRVRLDDYPEGRKLACGCVVYSQHEVMSASLGSSCGQCYDRMSDSA